MLTSSSGSPAHWSMHDSEGVSLSATEVADTFDLFARVEGELVNLNRENRKRGLPDVSYQAGLEQLEAEYGFHFDPDKQNELNWHQATLSKPAGGGRVLFAGEATCPLLYGATSWRVVSVFAIQSMMPNNSLLNIGCSSWGDIILM
eukprot:gene1888-2570_t